MLELGPDDWDRLADLLGQTDAIFAPVRSWACGSSSNTYYARKEYRANGLAWDVGGSTPNERKVLQRWLEGAVKGGLIERFKGSVYSTRLRLTEKAELATRARCGLPGVSDAESMVREVAKYGAYLEDLKGKRYRDDYYAWVPEWPNLGPVEPKQRFLTETFAYPALLRQWLVSGSRNDGLVSYKIGPVAVPDDVPDEDPKADVDEALYDVYVTALKKRLASLAVKIEANQRELGALPLPVSTQWDLKKLKSTKRVYAPD